MIRLVDSDGNIGTEAPSPSLLERLAQEAPELAERFNAIASLKIEMDGFRHFLYSTPFKEEAEFDPEQRPRWQRYIEIISSQHGLRKHIDFLEALTDNKLDKTGDNVLVVKSDRPFFDTVLAKGRRVGESEGWIGRLRDYQVTNVKDAQLYAIDGKVHRRLELYEARRMTGQELAEFAKHRIFLTFFHNATEGIQHFFKQLNATPSGIEDVVVYDNYSNTDFYIIEHVMKPDELAVADIDPDKVRWTELTQYYGRRKVAGSRYAVSQAYNDPLHRGEAPAFFGTDPRDVSEIYNEVMGLLNGQLREELSREGNTGLFVFVGKRIHNPMTNAQKEAAMKSSETEKWFWKHIKEQGLRITDETMIQAVVWGHQEGSRRLTDIIAKGMSRIYSPMTTSCGCGLWAAGFDNMYANTYMDIIREPEHGFYCGEAVEMKSIADLEWFSRRPQA